MSTYIDQKYLHLLSANLPLFKRKNDNLYNFRCPYCGDSQVSSTKARGYVYLKEANYNFKCHNCSYGTTLRKLIQDTDPELYKQYIMERFSISDRKPKVKPKIPFNTTPKYVRKEDIPEEEISQEKEIYHSKAAASGKPEKVIEKIVEGQLTKYFSEVCLYEQSFVKDDKITVGELISERILLTKENINLRRFERFKLGEGIEKKEQDFVAEVAAQLG